MALITQYSAANRVLDTALTVTYTKRRITGTWVQITYVASDVSTTYHEAWEYMRHAVKSYRYVGMTLDAARDCRTDMIALYTRTVKHSEWKQYDGEFDVSPNAENIPMAEVSIQHDEGDAYTVVINVNEVDTRLSLTSYNSARSLFPTEADRSYDGETEEEES